jgi:chitinase
VHRVFRLLSLAVIQLPLWAAPAHAQAAVCAGVSPWDASAIYQPGDSMVYENRLYEALTPIWGAPPDYCPTCNWYRDLGACSGGGNQAPTVTLTAPTNGASFNAGTNVVVSADAQDRDGSVARVEFFRDATSLGIATQAPYSVSWDNVPAGSYSIKAVAIDNTGATASSSSVAVSVSAPAPGTGSPTVLGYFTQWGIYGRNYHVKNIESSGSAAQLTHINYAFGNVRNNRCEVGVNQPSNEGSGVGGDAYADYGKAYDAAGSVSGIADTWSQPLRGNWNQLRQLKAKYPKLKLLISLGGWTWSRGFSSAARPENRQAFVASCIDAYIKGNVPVVDGAGGPGAALGVFDGIDIDWEYPAACGLSCGGSEDTANFTALLAEFRRQLNAVRPGLLLTVAVGAGVDKIRGTDPAAYAQSLDFINVMTYDFHGGWESRTGFHSALYAPDGDPSTGDEKQYNSHDAIQALLAAGVPAAKLNLGIGFYGRGWTGVGNANNGLFQSGSAAPGTYEAGIEDYKVLKNLGYPGFDNVAAGAHWIYNGSTWWSFDDPANIQRKMNYVKSQGLGGAFTWEFSGDDANGTLLKAVANGLK